MKSHHRARHFEPSNHVMLISRFSLRRVQKDASAFDHDDLETARRPPLKARQGHQPYPRESTWTIFSHN
jgi:hypothetical protein